MLNMEKHTDRSYLFLLGIAGSLIAIIGDILLGYAVEELGFVAGFGIVREGHSGIALWRLVLSLVLAMIAFTLYLPALWEVSGRLSRTHPKSARAFWWLSLADALGWGLLHAAYCWPIYAYRLLGDAVGSEIADSITASLMQAVFPFALFYVLLSIVPFGILFILIVPGRSVFPRWTAFCTPSFLFGPLYILYYQVLPLNTATYTLALGIMNQCMLALFTALLFGQKPAADVRPKNDARESSTPEA